jgi:hypothetical protein
MRLDLSGASQTIVAQLSKLRASITADILGTLRATVSMPEASPVNPNPSLQTTPSLPTPAPPIQRVAVVDPVDNRPDFPYVVPVNWIAHGGGDIADHNKVVNYKPNRRRYSSPPLSGSSTVTAIVAGSLMGLPTVAATSTSS